MHLAIILDGNRRYAKKLAMQPWKGHDFGAETVEKLLDWAKELNIHELTLYTLSIENLKRNKDELDYLFKLLKNWFTKFKDDERLGKDKVKVNFIGNLKLLPKNTQDLCKEIEEKTKTNKNYMINFCIAYGGRQELLQAMNKLKTKKGEITEKNLKEALWLKDEPEIIIRTGGQIRTSNFMPWQAIYSEWFFLDKLWPEFTKQDLIQILEQFKQRQRNFGR